MLSFKFPLSPSLPGSYLERLYVILTFESVNENLCLAIQMEAIKPHFNMVLFIMLYKVVLTFKSVDKTLECDHSN